MKASEAHNLKDDELLERIRQTREEQFALRLQHAVRFGRQPPGLPCQPAHVVMIDGVAAL